MNALHVFFAHKHIFQDTSGFDGTNQHPFFYAPLNCHSSF